MSPRDLKVTSAFFSASGAGAGEDDFEVLAASGEGIVVGGRVQKFRGEHIIPGFPQAIFRTVTCSQRFNQILYVTLMDQRVLVSHAAPKDFQGTPNWSKVCSSITSRLPLRNVTLRSPRNATTPVADLPVSLVPLESVREESVSQIPGSVLEKPLLHLYILYCQVCMPCVQVRAGEG